MTPRKARWANFLERVAWTLLQVASAEGLVLAYEAATGGPTWPSSGPRPWPPSWRP